MASTKGSYQTKFPEKLISGLTYTHREYPAPLDDSSVWDSLEDLQAYINATGTHAYPGQIVSVANGTVESTNGDKEYSMYVIRSDMSLQPISGVRSFKTAADAEAAIAKLEVGTVLAVWNETKEQHELFTVENSTQGGGKKELQRQSFNADDIPDITWANIEGRPESTVGDIDNSVTFTKKFAEVATVDGDETSPKALSYNNKRMAYFEEIPTEYLASKITGVISIENLPAGALERIKVVEDEEARAALTINEVQPGDTVKINSSGQMYFVKGVAEDGTLLYEGYTATAATSVPWSGVTGKPTSVDGYGITDAVKTSDVSETAEAGKLLKMDANGKLPASITGDAATLGGHAADYFAVAEDTSDAIEGLTTDMTKAKGDITGLDTRTTALETASSTQKTTLETLTTTTIPNIQNGTDITALAASKLTGRVDRAHLPIDVSGGAIEVANATERKALTNTQVHTGFLVKETIGGSVYVVIDDTKLDEDAGYMRVVALSEENIEWTKITNTPTTLNGYGITDAVPSSDVVTSAAPNKIIKTNASGNLPVDIEGNASKFGNQLPSYYATAQEASDLDDRVTANETAIANLKNGSSITTIDASKISGVINIDNLPPSVIERLVTVQDDAARKALTTSQVQNGDTVKVMSTELMYLVVDDTKLNSDDGYEPYRAGSAASVPWSGVTGKPTTLSGYGITDAVSADDLVTTASAANKGKILVLNDDGKLDVQITGAVAWSQLTDKPSSTVAQIDAAVTASSHTNRTTLDGIGAADYNSIGHLTYNSKTLATIDDVTTISAAEAKKVIQYSATEPANATEGMLWIQPI